MNILITNIFLLSRSGTETFVRDLALKLRGLGHYPMVYTPKIGNIADEIINTGIPVVSDLSDIPCKPDIIHGHHHIQTINALLHFCEVPGIFICHDRLSKNDVPPLHKRILFYVAVDYNCRQRLINSGIPEEKIKVIYNSVDTDRFLPRSLLPEHPKRALVFSNYASENNYLEPIIAACGKLNIELDIMGTDSNTGSACPEKVLGKYDLVFAKARCAIEAMACGAAVILCDYRGLGSMVTTSELEELRSLNFGMRCLKQPIKEKNIIRQINRYNAQDAKAVSVYIRQKATLSNMVGEYLNLYNQALAVVSDKKLDALDEFKIYLDSLSIQAEKCRLIISPYRINQWKWGIQYYLKRFIQLLQEPKMLWKEIISQFQPAVDNRIPDNGIILDPNSICISGLGDRINDVDNRLIEISKVEEMFFKYKYL